MLRIATFSEGLEKHFIKAIDSFGGSDSIRGMVIDLRNNPGGVVVEGVRTADLFLKSGVIVSIGGRAHTSQEKLEATDKDPSYAFKTAVLINRGKRKSLGNIRRSVTGLRPRSHIGRPFGGHRNDPKYHPHGRRRRRSTYHRRVSYAERTSHQRYGNHAGCRHRLRAHIAGS